MADQMTITETTADGTTTVIEITEASDDSTLIEDVIEALSGDEANAGFSEETADTEDAEYDVIEADNDFEVVEGDSMMEDANATDDIFVATTDDTDSNAATLTDSTPGVMTVDEAYTHINDNHETGGIGMTVDEAYASLETGNASVSVDEAYADLMNATAQTESAAQTIPDYAAQTQTDTNADELAAHAAAAQDAQAQADEFIAAGDYAAAAEAREAAENEAYQAGNYDALHGSNQIDLTTAATDQTNAAYYEQQEAAFAQSGDYEAAHEAASRAAEATGNADWNAGGEDHTAQAKAEEFQTGYAAWEQNNADYYAENAANFAADGNFDAAAEFAQSADEHQIAADYHGDLGEHGAAYAVYDETSAVETGGSYEAAPVTDYSSYDTGSTDGSIE